MEDERAEQAPSEFLAELSGEGVPEEVAAKVYAFVRGGLFNKGRRIHPEDDLYRTYGICEDDLDDAVIQIARLCGAKTPTNADVAGQRPVKTVKDLARIISHILKAQGLGDQ